MESWGYEHLPVYVVLNIFSYLPLRDKYNAASTCKSWMYIFQSAENWKFFHFRFYNTSDRKFLKCVECYRCYFRYVIIELDQFEKENRENAMSVIRLLATSPERRLEHFTIICTGKNPLFYAGKDFVEEVEILFSGPMEGSKLLKSLKYVNLGQFPMLFSDSLINKLSLNYPNLQYLDIQNEPLICKISPEGILHLLKYCRKLRVLCLLKYSLNDDVLLALTESNRSPLEHLSIKCRSEEKYISSEKSQKQLSSAWKKVVQSLPNLTVALYFDQTCPLNMVSVVMQPEIPCSILRLETFTMLYKEIKLAADYYSKTLEKIIIQAPSTKELNEAILGLSKKCHKLQALHVFCLLQQNTIDTVLNDHPNMKNCGTFTLRSSRGTDGPWATEELLRM